MSYFFSKVMLNFTIFFGMTFAKNRTYGVPEFAGMEVNRHSSKLKGLSGYLQNHHDTMVMALFLLYAPWQISFLSATWQISFAPGHGKYSLCIMKIIVYGSWHFLFYIFILWIMPGNYSLCIFLISGS